MKLIRRVGSTSHILQVFLRDSSSTTGTGLTGLTNASSGLVAYYHRNTDTTATAISLVTMTVGTYTSGGFKEIDSTNMPGWYQFCPPDAAYASGASGVVFHLKGATNMAPLPIEIDLDAQVDVYLWNGTAVSTPATAGIPEVNVKNINNVATTSVTTVNANVGTTQPHNFTGTGASALIKSDMVDIAGAAVSTSTAQLGVNVVNVKGTASAGAAGYVGVDWSAINAPTTTVNLSGTTIGTATTLTGAVTLSAGDSPVLQSGTAAAGGASTITLQTALGADSLPVGCVVKITSGTGAKQARIITAYVDATKVATVDRAWTTAPDNTSVYSVIYTDLPALSSGLKITGVSLVDTLTTYTGNTPQTGDSFARIGATGSGLTSLAPSATALSTVQWTNTLATNLGTLASHDPGATLGTSTLTQAQVTGGAYALNSASFAFNAALDFTTAQKAATLARVTLTDTATTLTNLPSIPANWITSAGITNGAITDAKFTTPSETSGRPTTILAMVRRIWEWQANKRTRDRSNGTVLLRNAADSGTLETQTQSTASTVDTQTQGV